MNRFPPDGFPKDVLAAFVVCVLAVTLALVASSVSWDPALELLSAGGAIECDLSTGSLLGSSTQR